MIIQKLKKTKSLSVNTHGFTLVEIAIVITIVGLLIGGILKGQQLLENARITITIKQVQSFRAAEILFRDMYNQLPGDIPTANAHIVNCTIANNCYNGDGNSIIGTTSIKFNHDDQSASIAMPDVETTMFWTHLTTANLINGVNSNSDPLVPEWTKTHPAAKLGGGFHVLNANQTGDNPANGHYYVLRLAPTGKPHPKGKKGQVLSPILAFRIDIKIDDGNARTGNVRINDAGSACSVIGVGTYQNNKNKKCLMIFSME